MIKKTVLGLMSAVAMTLAVAAPAMAATQSYKFYYYNDSDNSGTLTVGDECWRNSTGLTKGMFMYNPPYNTWLYSSVSLIGSNFTINNLSDIGTCKNTSSGSYSLTVGYQHLLKDQYGTTVYFTPSGGSSTTQGLIGGNSNF